MTSSDPLEAPKSRSVGSTAAAISRTCGPSVIGSLPRRAPSCRPGRIDPACAGMIEARRTIPAGSGVPMPRSFTTPTISNQGLVFAVVWSPSSSEPHLLADGIAPLQHLVHEALIDDRDGRAGREIGGGERAPGENGSLQHVEIRRIDAGDRRLRGTAAVHSRSRRALDWPVTLGSSDSSMSARDAPRAEAARRRSRPRPPAAPRRVGAAPRASPRTPRAVRRVAASGFCFRRSARVRLDPHRQILLGGESDVERLDVAQLDTAPSRRSPETPRSPRPARR